MGIKEKEPITFLKEQRAKLGFDKSTKELIKIAREKGVLMSLKEERFQRSYDYIKQIREDIDQLPNRCNIGGVLYESFKSIDEGHYEFVQWKLKNICKLPPFEGYNDLMYKTLNAYVEAHHAMIPHDFRKERLSDMQRNRRLLSELVESFAVFDTWKNK